MFLSNDTIIPIEVKNKRRIEKSDLKGITRFLDLFNSEIGYLINLEEEKVVKFNEKKIVVTPVLKFFFTSNGLQPF